MPSSALLASGIMILLPVTLAWVVVRRLGTPVRFLAWGAGTFLLAQAVRLPLLQGLTALLQSGALPLPPPAYLAVFNIAILAVTAGLFEEGARYLAYRHAIPDARSWNAAVTFGVGHGGIESILLGCLMAWQLAALPAGPDTLPWAVPFLGAVERVFALALHVALAVVVLQAITRRNLAWLAAAIGAHAAANAIGVSVLAGYGPIAAEAALGLVAVLALAVLFRLRAAG
ncbi:hypothetical protein W911_10840 [Hyphomicrobium nitrativorans NL23]|uniref:YhfC family intramembrane metalloprotease n=1 Tax=Hyphomicrobium nitrativorans NL23 TaxID=1029756 RepID=V5SH35_9HYPH|nr:YhfC family glutamic-type intramembrane protease [Hyphomicrobium nitrativorans]AHB50201.1 hypothetical protein W911_10840 [Hyphomicrobium nitrativorans NL23]